MGSGLREPITAAAAAALIPAASLTLRRSYARREPGLHQQCLRLPPASPIRQVKMDWCNTDGMVPNGPTGVYPAMSKALNDTGRPIHFNMCEWGLDDPWEW